MADITDIRQVRKKRKQKKTIIRIVLVLIIIIGCFFGFLYRNEIRNFLEGTYNNISLTQNASGYPQIINGTQVEKVFTSNEKIAVLSDMSLTLLSDEAKRITTLKHSYNNPDAYISGKYILIFNRGGNKFSLYTNEKEIYTITTNAPILETAVSSSGKVAVATGSDTNNTTMIVYSKEKEEVLKWNSSNQVTSISFSEDDSKLCVSSVHTKNGLIFSNITVMKQDSSKPVFEKTIENQMILRTYYNSKGNIFALGDTKTFLINSQGEIKNQVDYKTNLTAFCNSNDNLVIFEGENSVVSGGIISIFDCDLNLKSTIDISQKLQSLTISEQKISFVTDRKVFVYNLEGTLTDEFISDGKYIYSIVNGGKIVGITSSTIELLK